jgi:hypothetical protein
MTSSEDKAATEDRRYASSPLTTFVPGLVMFVSRWPTP